MESKTNPNENLPSISLENQNPRHGHLNLIPRETNTNPSDLLNNFTINGSSSDPFAMLSSLPFSTLRPHVPPRASFYPFFADHNHNTIYDFPPSNDCHFLKEMSSFQPYGLNDHHANGHNSTLLADTKGKGKEVVMEWTPQEDRHLMVLIRLHEEMKWSQITKYMPNMRSNQQCKQIWLNQLKPQFKKDKWSSEEEMLISEAHKELASNWREIAKIIPGKSEVAIQSHWIARVREYHKTLAQQGPALAVATSPLQSYIRALYAPPRPYTLRTCHK